MGQYGVPAGVRSWDKSTGGGGMEVRRRSVGPIGDVGIGEQKATADVLLHS